MQVHEKFQSCNILFFLTTDYLNIHLNISLKNLKMAIVIVIDDITACNVSVYLYERTQNLKIYINTFFPAC